MSDLLAKSPYAGRKIRPIEHLILAAFWFGHNFIWGAFLGPVLSSQVTRLSPRDTTAALSFIYFCGALPAMVVPLIVGPLSDRCNSRYGRRKPYVAGGAVIALFGFVLMAFGFDTVSLPSYLGGYLLIQLGTNIALAAYSAVIPDLVPVDQRGTASGYFAIMSQLATLAGAIISGQLLDRNLHNPLFLTIAITYTVFGVMSLVGLKEPVLHEKQPPLNVSEHLKSLWVDPRKYPDFGWVWLTRFLMMMGFYAILPYILFFLRDVIHVAKPASQSSLVVGIILIMATVSGFLGGIISDKVGRKVVVINSSLIVAACCILFSFCNSLPTLLLVGVFFGLGYGAYISVDWALATDVLPSEKDAAKDMAVWHVSQTLPQQLAPVVGGTLILGQFKAGTFMLDGQEVTRYSPIGFVVLFVVSAVFFGLGGILVKKVRGAR